MKKFKKGYTLAEVLIALAITGVVGALVIPQIGSNIQKARTGLTLARTIEEIELGAHNYLQAVNESSGGSSTYTLISQIPNVNAKTLARFIGMTERTDIEYTDNSYNIISLLPSLMPTAYAFNLSGVAGVQVFTGAGGSLDDCNFTAADIDGGGLADPSTGKGANISNEQYLKKLAACGGGGGGGSSSGGDDSDDDDDNKSGGDGFDCETLKKFILDPDKLPDKCKGFTPGCPVGEFYNLETGACENIPICPVGKRYNPQTGACENIPTLCPEGETYNPQTGACEKIPPSCQEGETYNPETGACEIPEQDKNTDTPRVFSSRNGTNVIFTGPINTQANRDNAVVAAIIIDTNGLDKKPNIYGKDAFIVLLNNSGKVEPYGLSTYKTNCANGNIIDSTTCAARVVADGYKIKY